MGVPENPIEVFGQDPLFYLGIFRGFKYPPIEPDISHLRKEKSCTFKDTPLKIAPEKLQRAPNRKQKARDLPLPPYFSGVNSLLNFRGVITLKIGSLRFALDRIPANFRGQVRPIFAGAKRLLVSKNGIISQGSERVPEVTNVDSASIQNVF